MIPIQVRLDALIEGDDEQDSDEEDEEDDNGVGTPNITCLALRL